MLSTTYMSITLHVIIFLVTFILTKLFYCLMPCHMFGGVIELTFSFFGIISGISLALAKLFAYLGLC